MNSMIEHSFYSRIEIEQGSNPTQGKGNCLSFFGQKIINQKLFLKLKGINSEFISTFLRQIFSMAIIHEQI